MNNLYHRHCLRLLDFNDIELKKMIVLAATLKKIKKQHTEKKLLKNKNIALIFEKESTRTRCSFEVAAFDQGANVTYLGPGSTHLGIKESIEDTAQVLSRLYDGIEYRGHNHEIIKILAKYSRVPVWNGLTNKFHPTQLLADLLTITEIIPNRPFCEIKCAYVGDAHNNMGNSLLEAAAILGLDLRLVSPKECWPKIDLFQRCRELAKKNNGKIICTESISEGVINADFIYTDIWVSMGESKTIWEKRISLLKKYQVNDDMLNMTNNSNIKILHCLPALHDNNTHMSHSLMKKNGFENGIEITNSVFQKNKNVIFEQAENRLHTIKSLLLSTLLKEIAL